MQAATSKEIHDAGQPATVATQPRAKKSKTYRKKDEPRKDEVADPWYGSAAHAWYCATRRKKHVIVRPCLGKFLRGSAKCT